MTFTFTESRKMVLMNLFAGQQWRCRHRKQTCGHSGGKKGWDELREYTRHDEVLREPLVRRQGSQVSMSVARVLGCLELSQQCENFSDIIVLQFVDHPPGSSVMRLMATSGELEIKFLTSIGS